MTKSFSRDLSVTLIFKILIVLFDGAVVLTAYILASALLVPKEQLSTHLFAHGNPVAISTIMAISVLYAMNVYLNDRQFTTFNGLILLWKAIAFAVLAEGIVIAFYPSEMIERRLFATAAVFQAILLTVTKMLFSIAITRFGRKERAKI